LSLKPKILEKESVLLLQGSHSSVSQPVAGLQMLAMRMSLANFPSPPQQKHGVEIRSLSIEAQ
jgi:hypothetical protein